MKQPAATAEHRMAHSVATAAAWLMMPGHEPRKRATAMCQMLRAHGLHKA